MCGLLEEWREKKEADAQAKIRISTVIEFLDGSKKQQFRSVNTAGNPDAGGRGKQKKLRKSKKGTTARDTAPVVKQAETQTEKRARPSWNETLNAFDCLDIVGSRFRKSRNTERVKIPDLPPKLVLMEGAVCVMYGDVGGLVR